MSESINDSPNLAVERTISARHVCCSQQTRHAAARHAPPVAHFEIVRRRYALPAMNRHKALATLLGLLLVLCCNGCSRRHYAKATVEFGRPNDANAQNAIRALLPKDDPSVTLRTVRNTGLYEIGVYDLDPHNAAKRANELVATIHTSLNDESAGKRFKIWERAEPPIKPTR